MRTLLQLSDLHFGKIDDAVLSSLTPYLKSLAHDVMVVSGDFTQRATKAQYEAAMAWLSQFNAPKLCVPGNHDVPLYALWERFFFTFRRYRTFVTRELSPVYEDDELLVLGVATPRAFVPVRKGFWKDGAIQKRQLAHVIARAASSPEKACIVVTHHPFIPPPGHRPDGTVRGGGRVLPVLAASTVDVLLAGHLHASYHAEIPVRVGDATRSIVSVQAATATSFRRRHRPDGTEYPNAFNLLRCARKRIEIEVHAFEKGLWGINSRAVYNREGARWVEEKTPVAIAQGTGSAEIDTAAE